MQIRSVETTPNPNSIKLNMVDTLGQTATYTSANSDLPDFVSQLLAISGVQSVFVCGDFITLNRHPLTDWRQLLEQAALTLTGENIDALANFSSVSLASPSAGAALEGQNQIFVQTFKGIPIQVKAVDLEGETRLSLGITFNEAAQKVQEQTGSDYLKERQWVDHGIRYGSRVEVAEEVQAELQSYFAEDRLAATVNQALGHCAAESADFASVSELFGSEQWQQRLVAVQELSQSAGIQSEPAINLLLSALLDSNAQVRRLAAAALGTTGSAEAVPALCQSLIGDTSIAVRRTAGDALSDIGDASAQQSMCQALTDKNKLVRWRAARFLNDLGTSLSLPFLAAALSDSEYEVQLEVQAAISRITAGAEGGGPAWKRIADLQS
ncbi:conserved virulence factor C family protein [soil metagenome]